jgi:hypothetical protein
MLSEVEQANEMSLTLKQKKIQQEKEEDEAIFRHVQAKQ